MGRLSIMVIHEEEIIEQEQTEKNNKKKLLMILVPCIVIIGILIALYQVVNKNITASGLPYRIIKQISNTTDADNMLVIYNLPEIIAKLKSNHGATLSMRISLEFKNKKDIETIEALTAKIQDAILTISIELAPEDVEGSKGIYWLKEEILHRVNLITAPIEIVNIDFRSFDIQNIEKD